MGILVVEATVESVLAFLALLESIAHKGVTAGVIAFGAASPLIIPKAVPLALGEWEPRASVASAPEPPDLTTRPISRLFCEPTLWTREHAAVRHTTTRFVCLFCGLAIAGLWARNTAMPARGSPTNADSSASDCHA